MLLRLKSIAKAAWRKPSLWDYRSVFSMWVSHEHRFIFAHVPKVASSSMVKWFADIHNIQEPSDCTTRQYIHKHMSLATLSRKEFVKVWNSYFKFAFVRDPCEKLVSVYRSFFVKVPKNRDQISYQNHTIRMLRHIYDYHGIAADLSRGATFKELVEYLAGTKSDDRLDRHLRSQTWFVKPLLLDRVFQLEKLDYARAELSKTLRMPVDIPVTNVTKEPRNTELKIHSEGYLCDIPSRELLQRSYMPLSCELYTETLRNLVVERYNKDIKAFCYGTIDCE